METHTLLNDTDFIREIVHGVLPPHLFTHEAHLRLAWIHLRASPPTEAIDTVNQQVRGYVDALGVSHKYKHTLTTAAVLIVHHFMKLFVSNSFKALIDQFPQLSHSFNELIARHYSTDIWELPLAKTSYLKPDLLSFDH